MTQEHFARTWEEKAKELEQLGAHVDGARLVRAMLADLHLLQSESADDLLNLVRAARESGYSERHLARLLARGDIPNAGRPNAPKVRRADLPIKPSILRGPSEPFTLPPATSRRIARAVVTSTPGARR